MKIYRMMPAWVENKDDVFEEWDLGKRNQTFPQNDMAIVVDSRGFYEDLLEKDPEKILEFSDWTESRWTPGLSPWTVSRNSCSPAWRG